MRRAKKKIRRDCSLEIPTTGIFLKKNLTILHKAGRLRATLLGLSGKHRVVAILPGWTEIMRRRRREMRAQLCLNNFFFPPFFLFGWRESLRSDIRLSKLTSARTCPRYEMPRSFSCSSLCLSPPLSREGNERMRRAENEIQGGREVGGNT